MTLKTCRVLMVQPHFTAPSFWNFWATCDAIGVRSPVSPLNLITVAAMLPSSWDVRLIDRNTEELTSADLDQADLVMTGGMMAQKTDTLEIIKICRARGIPVVVGGPDVTSSPYLYDDADFQVQGEAEDIMAAFVNAWTAGERRGVFKAEKFQVDITRSPIPRFDLLTLRHYTGISIQFSRGCPFTCEFCDIIELYGRVPRTKTNEQMLAELDALYRLGFRGSVFFVDDNFIGNKKAIKHFLPALVTWQKEHGYPFTFGTEASINLADDDQLLGLMRQANFIWVFIGIESPDADTLTATQKKQNTRRSLVTSVNKIYGAGMVVYAGFIVGFDSEKKSMANEMIDCIEAMSISVCMMGLLTALPGTQLTRRLAREGRLHRGHDVLFETTADLGVSGLNFVTLRPRRDVLVDYTTILEKIYSPDAYFGRVRRVGRLLNLSDRPTASVSGHQLLMIAHLIWRLSKEKDIRGHLWSTAFDCALHNLPALEAVLFMAALYLHLGPFARYVRACAEEQIASIESGEMREFTAASGTKIVDAEARFFGDRSRSHQQA